MIAWRLAKRVHASAPLDGEGARLWGGRWNSPGQPLVYLGPSPAAVALEVLVHLVDVNFAPTDYVLIEVEIPDAVVRRATVVGAGELPKDWQSAGNAACVERGDAWLAARGHPAVCRVPSAVTPETECLLLDPSHRDAKRVKVRSVREWRFDGRLFRGGDASG